MNNNPEQNEQKQMVLVGMKELAESFRNLLNIELEQLKKDIKTINESLNPKDKEITPKELYKKHGCSLYSQKRWRDAGLLGFERRGVKKVVYKQSDVEKFFKSHERLRS
jgi:hypothetical protein